MIQFIQAATSSESNEERSNAEKTIMSMREQNPNVFFEQIAEVFRSTEVPKKIREASGTILAVSILAKNKNGEYIWETIEGTLRVNIKNGILQVLIDSDRNVRRAAANIVSAICYIELPKNEWDGIVDKICVNINHDNQIVKEASILTLGFICSRMKERTDFTFSLQTQQNILSGIVLGLQQTDNGLVETSLKALRDSISSLSQIFSNEQYRSFILQRIVEIINSGKFTIDGLQILGEFVKSSYEYLSDYIEGMVTLLEPLISNSPSSQIRVAATQVWQNVASEFNDLKITRSNLKNYITGALGEKIVSVLLTNLYVMEDGENADENIVSESASKALETIFDNGSQEYKLLVLNFVQVSISQNNWKYRQASVKAFSLLLYGLPDEENQALISSSLNELMGLLNDSSIQVQYATMESLVIITEICGNFFIKSEAFLEYLKLIVSKIYISQSFLKEGCKIVENLCEAEKEMKLGKFKDIADELIGIFLQISLANDSSLSVIGWSISTMLSLIETSNNEYVAQKYIAFVLENFDNIKKVGDSEKRENLYSAFFTIIQYCLHTLKNVDLDVNLLTSIYQRVIENFKSNNDVSADGFYVVESLVWFFHGDQRLLEDFWPYIGHALTKWEDPMLPRATTTCISAFTSVYGDNLGNKLETFVPSFLQMLRNPNFDRETKLDILIVLGETFLNCSKAANQYLSSFMEVIMICCTAAIGMTESDFNYSEQLKENIIETLMCVVHGVNQENSTISDTFIPYISDSFKFIIISCDKKYRPTLKYLSRAIFLMADIVKFYPVAAKPYKQQPLVRQCIETLKQFDKKKQYAQTIKYAEQQLK